MYRKLEDDFNVFSPKSSSSSKKLLNPLYNTLLAGKTLSAIKKLKYQHKETQKGKAFYIALSAPAELLSFQGFAFNECHLTVNQYYKNDDTDSKNGFNTVHYTETYKNKEGNEQITVHVYLTREGQFQYTQVKHATDKNVSELTLTSDELTLINSNIAKPSLIVQKLLTANSNFYKQAVDTANKIEKELQVLFSRTQKESIQQYIKKAAAFIEAIEQINLFSYTSKDVRGKLMATQINNLNTMLLDFQDTSSKSQEISESPSVVDENLFTHIYTPPTVTSSNRKVQQASDEYKKTESLIKDLEENQLELNKNPNKVSLLIQRDEIKRQLNLQLLFLSSCSLHLSKQQRKTLSSWNTLKPYESNLIDIFFKYFWEGDLAAIEELYPLTGHLITENHITQLLSMLLFFNPEDEKTASLIKKNFDFIYNNSSLYQIMLHGNGIMLYHGNSSFPVSLLIKVYYNNNLFAYRILLEQGLSPNSVGTLYQGKCIPCILIMVTLKLPHQKEFLELALHYGAHYTTIPRAIKSPPQFSKQNKEESLELLSHSTFIERSCAINNYVALTLFLPQMSMEDLLETLARISEGPDIILMNKIPSAQHGCFASPDPKSKASAFNKLTDKANKRLFGFLLHSDDEAGLTLINLLLNLLKPMIHDLSQKSPQILAQLQENTLKEIRNINQENNLWYKFKSCLFLYALDPKPTFMKYQSIMQLYCIHAAYMNTLSFFPSNVQQQMYSIARYIAEKTCFSDQLMKTKLYEFVLNKLDSVDSTEKPKLQLK